MEFKNFIKKTLSRTCVYFTLITVLYSLLVLFVNISAEEIILEGSRIIMFLFFSFITSIGMTIFSLNAIPAWARYLLNYALCAFAFFLCILLPASSDGQAAGFLLVGIFFFTLIYVVCAALIALFRSRYKRLNEQEADYKKHFSK